MQTVHLPMQAGQQAPLLTKLAALTHNADSKPCLSFITEAVLIHIHAHTHQTGPFWSVKHGTDAMVLFACRLLEAPDLESAAPPVELDRPSRPQPADEDRAEPQQPQPEPASPVLTLLGPALPGAAPDDTPVTGDLQSPSQQSPVPEPVSQATYYAFENNPSPQALSLGIADTTSPHQEGQSHSSDVSNAALAAKPTEQTSPKLAAADGDVETSLLSTADGHALSGKADKAGPSPSFPRSLATTSESGIVTQDSALALASIAESGEGEDTQHDGQVRSAGAMADSKAQVEEDLDKVIQELSMEVR